MNIEYCSNLQKTHIWEKNEYDLLKDFLKEEKKPSFLHEIFVLNLL